MHVPRLLIAAALAALTFTCASPQPPARAEANPGGSVLYSPDLSIFPDAKAGYPRAIELTHDEASPSTVLASFAKEKHNAPTSLPIYRSTDHGATWMQVSEIFSHTPGWDLEAPTLYEVPRDAPGLKAGDILAAGTAWRIGDYTQQAIEVFISHDHGATWSYLSNCTQTSNMPNTWGHGIWEPVFLLGDNGTLGCFISDERPANTRTNNQFIGHYTSIDGGRTWSTEIIKDVYFPNDDLARPGMQTFAQLPDGRTVMSYEMCRDATDPDHACETYIKFSDDGLTWGPANEAGTLVSTADERHLLHTPYISWSPFGGTDGTLIITGQRVTSGPTGNKTVLAESGTVALTNTHAGQGPWIEMSLPIAVSPTGGYASNTPSCPGYSSPVLPIENGASFLYFASTWLGVSNQCEIRVGTGTMPLLFGRLQGPAGMCLDVDTNTSVNGRAAQLWTCNSASGQQWALHPDGSLRSLGKCLDVDAQGTANHTKVQLWECNGSGAQRWELRADGSLFNPQSARCLDDPQGSTAEGTDLQIYDCNGLWTQRWSLIA